MVYHDGRTSGNHVGYCDIDFKLYKKMTKILVNYLQNMYHLWILKPFTYIFQAYVCDTGFVVYELT